MGIKWEMTNEGVIAERSFHFKESAMDYLKLNIVFPKINKNTSFYINDVIKYLFNWELD